MRVAALVVALFIITIGISGIVSPDSLQAARRRVMDTPGALYVTGNVRVAMGLVLILFAPGSRAPRILRVLGLVMCLQGIVPQVISRDRGRAIFEQQSKVGNGLLRLGAFVALSTGAFIVFAATPRRRPLAE